MASTPDYAVGELLGVGLLGPQRSGRYLPSGAEVLLEAVPEAVSSEPWMLERLAGLGRTAATLHDERVVGCYDLLEHDGRLFLVGEAAGDPALAERTGEGGLPVDRSLALAAGVLRALEAVHGAGLAHGALSRRTVLEGPHGVRLAGVPAGAVQAALRGVPATVANDLRATAGLLEGLLTAPLAAGAPRRHVPRAVARVVRRAQRVGTGGYGSAGEMLAALQAARSGGRAAGPAPLARRAISALSLRRLAFAAAAISVGVLGGLLADSALTPASSTLRMRTVALDVGVVGAACSGVVHATAEGAVDGQGRILYRWDASGGRSTAPQAIDIPRGTSGFDVSQTWRPQDAQGPASISFEILQPQRVVITRTVNDRCAG